MTEIPLILSNMCIIFSSMFYITNCCLFSTYLMKNHDVNWVDNIDIMKSGEFFNRLQVCFIGVSIMFNFFAYQFDIYKWTIFIATSTSSLEEFDI